MLLPDTTTAAWDELREALPLERWLAAGRAIADRHGLPDAAPTLYPTGSDVVMRVGEAVVKLSEPRWRAEIAMEAAMLARARGHLPVDTPTLLAQGELEGWPYVVMSVVQGEPLGEVWPLLSADERAHLAAQLGALLAAFRSIPVSPEDSATWAPFFARMRDGVLERHASRRKLPGQGWLDEILPFLASTALSERPLVWMHTELLGDHVLVARRGGRWELSALLDFADARVGHPFYELPALAEFVLRGERPLLRTLLLASGLSPDALGPSLSRELLAWSLLHQFGSIPRMIAACPVPEPANFTELSERLYSL